MTMATSPQGGHPYCWFCSIPETGQFTFSTERIPGMNCVYGTGLPGCTSPPEPPPPPPPPPPPDGVPPPPLPPDDLPRYSFTPGFPYCFKCYFEPNDLIYYTIRFELDRDCILLRDLEGCNPDVTPPPPPPDTSDKAYTIRLPGVQDIIRIPALENSEIRKERYLRFKFAQTPIPKPLQWIPGVINWLDDAQDLLITALYLAKPLLKRAPLRFIPGLGWILLANDILNLSTALISIPLGGRSFKRASLDALGKTAFIRKRTVIEATNFLTGRIPWLSAILQGAQASETLTGYGLSLGGIMGFAVDGFWGGLRFLQGKAITLQGVPKSDIASKAFRVLAQSWQIPAANNIFNTHEKSLVIAAYAMASQVVQEKLPRGAIANDYATISADPIPSPDDRFAIEFTKWMHDEAITYDPMEVGGGWLLPDPRSRPTIDQVHETVRVKAPIWEHAMREEYGPTTHGTAMSLLYQEAAQDNISHAAGVLELFKPLYTTDEKNLALSIEYGIIPNCANSPEMLRAYLDKCLTIAASVGKEFVNFEQAKQAASEACGGYTRATPKTFDPSTDH